MELTEAEILKLAKLARLDLSKDEITQYQKDIGNILGYVEKLNKQNFEKKIEVANISNSQNVFRKDEIKPSLPREKTLQNAPAQENGFIKVKNIMEKN